MLSASDSLDFQGTKRNKILIIGPDHTVILSFVTRLLRDTNQSDLIQTHLSSPEIQDGLTIPYTLDTRYYTAQTSLWVASTDTAANDISHWNVVAPAIDAVIYVFDRAEPTTFTHIHPWSDFLSSHDPNVSLCVAHSMDDRQDSSSGLDACEDWCIDLGFEFVDVCASATSEDAGDGGNSDAAREKFGFPRIIEALESNMWDGLVRKPTRTSGVSGDITSAQNRLSAPVTTSTGSRGGSDLAALYTETMSSFARELSDNDDEDDLDAEGFEVALQRLRHLREQSKLLSDEERRELTAKISSTLDDDDKDDFGEFMRAPTVVGEPSGLGR
ncbi:hypothetical protein SmJEL517_g01643 [Synchytrium microbalum]|uniref:Uncharacterized protein n=1 Tax=Synchytrium microbalum TaxID=1806994 RepID=A0A507CFC3_9FUNG|nr:uncharacterized protein SmJEL517_g01643 [Synchytrium microbalum]TPX36285.1 hypothetical protein SmJEL517_g01643 [Synchytrium microbalum]